jgi:hypothetical protein
MGLSYADILRLMRSRFFVLVGAFLRELTMEDKGRDIRAWHSGFLRLVSSWDARTGLAEEIDRFLRCRMEASPGRVAPR